MPPPSPPPTTTHPPLPHLNPPTELDLSPSKARAHATTTHAWSQVTQWLQTILAPPSSTSTSNTDTPLPPFERTPETLAYLQSLMRANRLADAAAREVEAARRAQVESYEAFMLAPRSGAVDDDDDDEIGATLLRELQEGLGPEGGAALRSLAEGCVVLGFVPDGGEDVRGEMGRRMLELTVGLCEVQELVEAVERLRGEVVEEGRQLGGDSREEVASRREGGYDEAADELEGRDVVGDRMSMAALRTKTAQLSAQTKHLALKAAEYRERRAALDQSGGDIRASIADLKQRERELEAQKDIVRRLESSLKEFHGLPPDLEASRAEVKRAQAELEMWKRKREELFEELGGS